MRAGRKGLKCNPKLYYSNYVCPFIKYLTSPYEEPQSPHPNKTPIPTRYREREFQPWSKLPSSLNLSLRKCSHHQSSHWVLPIAADTLASPLTVGLGGRAATWLRNVIFPSPGRTALFSQRAVTRRQLGPAALHWFLLLYALGVYSVPSSLSKSFPVLDISQGHVNLPLCPA